MSALNLGAFGSHPGGLNYEEFAALSPSAQARAWSEMQATSAIGSAPGPFLGGGGGGNAGPMMGVGGGAFTPHQPMPRQETPPEVLALQADVRNLSSTVQNLTRQLEERDMNITGPAVASTAGKSTKPKKVKQWYEREKDKSTSEQKAARLLNALAMCVLRELINVEAVNDQLPQRGEQTIREGGIPSFYVDFTKSAKDSYNAALMERAVESITERASKTVEGFTEIVDCPPIDVAAAKWTVKKQFDNLKKTHKEQTNTTAALAKKWRDHKNRALSTKKNKCGHRETAVAEFLKLHQRDPTMLLRDDFMSADESAFGDDEKTTRWWDQINQPAHMHTKGHKPLATQHVLWRAPWVTWVYHELDRLFAVTGKARASYPRVPVHDGGPVDADPPSTIPPLNMVDPLWLNLQALEVSARIDIDAWRQAVPHENWGSYAEESMLWPPNV